MSVTQIPIPLEEACVFFDPKLAPPVVVSCDPEDQSYQHYKFYFHKGEVDYHRGIYFHFLDIVAFLVKEGVSSKAISEGLKSLEGWQYSGMPDQGTADVQFQKHWIETVRKDSEFLPFLTELQQDRYSRLVCRFEKYLKNMVIGYVRAVATTQADEGDVTMH